MYKLLCGDSRDFEARNQMAKILTARSFKIKTICVTVFGGRNPVPLLQGQTTCFENPVCVGRVTSFLAKPKGMGTCVDGVATASPCRGGPRKSVFLWKQLGAYLHTWL